MSEDGFEDKIVCVEWKTGREGRSAPESKTLQENPYLHSILLKLSGFQPYSSSILQIFEGSSGYGLLFFFLFFLIILFKEVDLSLLTPQEPYLSPALIAQGN